MPESPKFDRRANRLCPVTQTKRVIMVYCNLDTDDEDVSPDWYYINELENIVYTVTDDFIDALDLAKLSKDEEIGLLIKARNIAKCDGDILEVVEVTQTIAYTYKPATVDEETITEQIRRTALDKLSLVEIEALGLNSLAVYNKAKFHGDECSAA